MSHASIIVALDKPGHDIEALVAEQMEPFLEGGEWFKDGSRWDWFTIGGRFDGNLIGKNVCQRSELTDAAMAERNTSRALRIWGDWEKERDKSPFIREHVYGFSEAETLETLTAGLMKSKLKAYAFLRGKRWHENARMGWFGGAASSECAIAGREKGKCIVGKISEPPCIIGFNEPGARWEEHYFSRFIENLAPDTTLVMVDFHV